MGLFFIYKLLFFISPTGEVGQKGQTMEHLFLKDREWSAKARAEVPVRPLDKFLDGEKKATELIQSGRYGLTPEDFWVHKSSSRDNSIIYYDTVCMKHTGCLKVNDSLPPEQRHDPSAQEGPLDESYANGMIMRYISPAQGIWEIAEVSPANLPNGAYPYAMLNKRLFDRVVLRLSKLAFSGIAEYSGPAIENEGDGEPTTPNYNPAPAPAKEAAAVSTAAPAVADNTPHGSQEPVILTAPRTRNEALALIMPSGTYAGKTLGQVLAERPNYAKFWADKSVIDPNNSFVKDYPAVIEACKLLAS